MREKIPSLIITFPTTTAAMAADRFCTEAKLPGRLIPVPQEITAGCGLAWKAPVAEKLRLCSALEAAGLLWSAMVVIIC